MGLDMYLNKKVYLGWNYEHRREQVGTLPNLKEFGIDAEKVSYIVESAGYWRKANAIHQWFVDNVQDGQDDCSKQSDVSKEAFEKLLDCVEKELLINEGHDEYGCAGDFLPVQEGFFFGSYDYDEWYYKDLEYTKNLIIDILKNWNTDSEYYYQSSW